MQNKNVIDVTIVATQRAELLDRTLKSLIKQMPMLPNIANAIINLDNTPIRDFYDSAIYLTVTNYLPIKIFMVSNQPSFCSAVKRVWCNTTAEYVLHLEDDWEFIRPLDINWCMEEMANGNADYIRFGKRKKILSEETKKVALLPSLWRGDIVRNLACCMDSRYDPEKQLRYGFNVEIDDNLPRHIIDYPNGQCVKDIGREWRESRKLAKWDKNNRGDITWSQM